MEIILVIVVLVTAFLLWSGFSDAKRDRERHEQDIEREARLAEEQAAAEARLGEYANRCQADGWDYISQGKMMHVAGQPTCLMMLDVDAKNIRFDVYTNKTALTVEESFEIATRDIISLNVARPKTKETRKETVPVSIVESKNKSPVGRGLVGGALLGPAGLVLGAASGLNSKTTTRVEHETVYREYDGLGAPQLIIGTRSMERPVLKVRCENQELADEWLFRIRALQG